MHRLPCAHSCAQPHVRPLRHAGHPLTHPAHIITGLGKAIQEQLNIACVCNDLTAELLRGARAHTTKFLSVLKPGDLEKARTYTCAHRADAMHVPCIAGRQPAARGLRHTQRVRAPPIRAPPSGSSLPPSSHHTSPALLAPQAQLGLAHSYSRSKVKCSRPSCVTTAAAAATVRAHGHPRRAS